VGVRGNQSQGHVNLKHCMLASGGAGNAGGWDPNEVMGKKALSHGLTNAEVYSLHCCVRQNCHVGLGEWVPGSEKGSVRHCEAMVWALSWCCETMHINTVTSDCVADSCRVLE